MTKKTLVKTDHVALPAPPASGVVPQTELATLPGDPASTADMPAAIFAADENAPRKRYTAARLIKREPRLYRAVVTMSREGIGVHRIAAYLGITEGTVRAVRLREKVTPSRDDIALNMREAAASLVHAVNRKMEDPEAYAKLGIKDAAFAAATISERADSLQGHATQIIEIQVSDPGRDEFRAACLAAMKQPPLIGLNAPAAGTMLGDGQAGQPAQGPDVIDADFTPADAEKPKKEPV